MVPHGSRRVLRTVKYIPIIENTVEVPRVKSFFTRQRTAPDGPTYHSLLIGRTS